nr:50S ribosomal protein L16 [Cavernulicola chilensis]
MKLQPNYIKLRKKHLRQPHGIERRRHILRIGVYGLKALQLGFISSNQIETIRRTLNKKLKVEDTNRVRRRFSRVWTRIFPDVPVTSLGAESRMGKGKGSTESWTCPVKPGQILFEFSGTTDSTAIDILRYVSVRLPIRVKLVYII